MAKKDEIIQFKKIVTYEMPEENWNNADEWYKNIYDSIYNLNSPFSGSSGNINITSRYPRTKDKLVSALQSRIDNKNNMVGDYGYGK